MMYSCDLNEAHLVGAIIASVVYAALELKSGPVGQAARRLPGDTGVRG